MRRLREYIIEKHKNLPLYFFFLLTIILRLVHFIKSSTFDFDEAVVWNVSILPVKDIINGNFFHFRFHPPLFYFLIHFWGKISDAEIWLHMPSFISSLLLVFLLYIFLKTYLNKKIATIGVLLYSISSFSIWWSSHLRIYQLLSMVSLIYLIIYVKILENSKKHIYWTLFLIVGILGIHLDYSFIWTFIIVNFHYIILNFKKAYKLVLWGLTNSLIVLNLVPYILMTGKKTLESHYALTWIPTPDFMGIGRVILELLYSDRLIYFGHVESKLLFILLSLILLLPLKETLSPHKNKILITFMVLVPIVISFSVSQIYPIFAAKNLFIVSLGLIALLSIYLERLKNHNWIFLIILSFWFFSNFWIISNFFYNREPNWKMANTFIRNNLPYNGKVIFLPAWFTDSFRYYNHKYKFINSDSQMISTLSLKQSYDIATIYKKNNQPHCVVYDTWRNDIDYQLLPKRNIINLLESYPVKMDLGGGVRIYCYHN